MATCPKCGEQNPDKARLCMMCGTALAQAVTGRRERRVVSVLFADLVGFTSRSEELDVEDVEGFLGRYHRLLRRELERHGGTVEKFIGDAVMALFGAPTAYEDDAERAVRAALAIQEAIADLRDRDGIDLHVRVGVTTGEALVALGADPSSGEGMATGDVVNTAARLQSAAPVDGVLVDERTCRATDRAIRYWDAAPVEAKGKSELVVVWRAVEPRSLLPEQTRIDDMRLVGRETELGLLVGALDRSRQESSAQLVTVVGAPGMGKTRLVQELGAYVEDVPGLIRWRHGRSLAYGEGVAFWALGEIVKAEAGILESDPAEVAEGKLGEAVAAVIVDERDRVWVTRHIRPLVGLEAGVAASVESGRVESFAAWRRFFEALAEDGPTVLVFEDLHWGDDGLLEFIDLLAERAGGVPLLVVCTARPELLERRPGWGGGKTNTQTLLLSPLSDEDTARLVGELLDQALLPAETQRALLGRAEGNPLYAQEYVRMLRDRGLLVRDGGGWRLVGQPEGLPESVQAIIAARLDTLGDEERRLIQDASVVGKTAWVGAVCAISDSSPWQAEELLHALERKQLLRRARRSSVAGEVEFSFAHALTQEVAYGQIRRPERAVKHERVGGWIEHLSGERDDKAELLAHHYATALALRQQAGEDTSQITGRARAALVEAGRQAQAVNAHATATRHLSAALALTTIDDSTRPRLLLDNARAAYHSGSADVATLRSALEAQVAARDWQAAAEASLVLADWLDVYEGRGEDAEAIDVHGYEYAIRGGYTPLASQIAYGQAFRLCVTGHREAAIGFTKDAIQRAEGIGDESGRALLMIWHGWARASTGDPLGIDEMREAAIILARHSHLKTSVAYHNLGEMLMGLGELQAAAQAHAESARWAERFGIADQMGAEQAAQAVDAYHAGDWTTAIDLCAPVIDHPAETVAAEARWVRGRIGLARGDPSLALEDAERIVERAMIGWNDEILIQGLALLAVAHHARGDPEAAAGACQRFFDRWKEIGGLPNQAPAVAALAVVSNQHDALREATMLLPDASRWKPALTAIVEKRYTDAATTYGEIGSLPLAAEAYLLAARQAADAAGHADATQYAEQALSFYRRVDATAYIREAEALLTRARSA